MATSRFKKGDLVERVSRPQDGHARVTGTFTDDDGEQWITVKFVAGPQYGFTLSEADVYRLVGAPEDEAKKIIADCEDAYKAAIYGNADDKKAKPGFRIGGGAKDKGDGKVFKVFDLCRRESNGEVVELELGHVNQDRSFTSTDRVEDYEPCDPPRKPETQPRFMTGDTVRGIGSGNEYIVGDVKTVGYAEFDYRLECPGWHLHTKDVSEYELVPPEPNPEDQPERKPVIQKVWEYWAATGPRHCSFCPPELCRAGTHMVLVHSIEVPVGYSAKAHQDFGMVYSDTFGRLSPADTVLFDAMCGRNGWKLVKSENY